MAPRLRKTLVWVELLGLVLPATLAQAFLLLLALPALPQRQLSAPQLAFDLGFVLVAVGLAAGWRLGLRYLRAGREGVRSLHRAWIVTLAVATLAGLAAAFIAVAHLLDPLDPGVAVGFALLAPGALLTPLTLQVLHKRRTGP